MDGPFTSLSHLPNVLLLIRLILTSLFNTALLPQLLMSPLAFSIFSLFIALARCDVSNGAEWAAPHSCPSIQKLKTTETVKSNFAITLEEDLSFTANNAEC